LSGRIYFDHSATTPLDPRVLKAMLPFLEDSFGNASSQHAEGRVAREAVENARAQVAALLNADANEIIFTSGGSEANNLAIKGTFFALNRKGAHIITSAVEHPAAGRARAYGLEEILVDGNDADAVYRTASAAYEKARAGGGPSLVECLTYRHSGHSRADPAKYRPEGELEKWKERDPIKIYRERLKQFGIAESAITAIETDVLRIVDAATEACKAAPMPPLDILTTDVYADGGFAWRN